MLDELKELGFLYANKAGISIGIDDMVIPGDKSKLVEAAEKQGLNVVQACSIVGIGVSPHTL